jgi:hypothetical protein
MMDEHPQVDVATQVLEAEELEAQLGDAGKGKDDDEGAIGIDLDST